MKDFIKKRLKESLEDTMLESILDEDYPTNFNMEEFKKLNNFAKRIRYCKDNLQYISSGSGRSVFKVDETKVLKLAKNAKGVAQNEAEAQWMNDYYFDSILAKVIDSHPKDLWVEMEMAHRVSAQMFKNYFGYPIDIIFRYIQHRFLVNNGKKDYWSDVAPEIAEVLHENQNVQSIYEFADANDTVGDLGRLNTYGLVKRGGQDTIVIIDFGLSGEVQNAYYK